MDNNRLESISVSAVNTYFSRNGYVVPHTSEQDKTPLWDGQLFIYKKRDEFSNETFNCQIPVQIKSSYHNGGKFPNRTTHSVTLVDLNNYLKMVAWLSSRFSYLMKRNKSTALSLISSN